MNQSYIDHCSLEPAAFVKLADKLGTLFFDSVGNFPKEYHQPLSLVAVSPSHIFRGHLSDYSELEHYLQSKKSTLTDLGYPDGGLAGWVDYEGNYTFGAYEQFWVYQHAQHKWIRTGTPPQWETKTTPPTLPNAPWEATTSKEEFTDMVRAAQSYIARGDIYQVNLSQQFKTPIHTPAAHYYHLYEALRNLSPAPMACYGNLGGRELMCSSPETFLKMSQNLIETRPIKGTRPRYTDSQQDQLSAYELMTSEKENAELLMITDLLRNDLGQVCEFGSVKVDELLSLEKLEHVYHMVSTVRGQLRPEVSQLKALQACLPGGSITGAPKLRAQSIISELEPVPRGLYTGTVGYLGFNGESQFNIVIRSMVRERKTLHYHVGAGIVADSLPESEYEETLVKAEGIRRALKAS